MLQALKQLLIRDRSEDGDKIQESGKKGKSKGKNKTASKAPTRLSVEASLHCVIAAFETLGKHGGAITIDLKEYYNHVYSLILDLCFEPACANTCVVPLMHCLGLMLCNNATQVSKARVLALTSASRAPGTSGIFIASLAR